jgi:hypothetical protein
VSSPKLGRNARLFKDGTVIGYAKDISVKALFCASNLKLELAYSLPKRTIYKD